MSTADGNAPIQELPLAATLNATNSENMTKNNEEISSSSQAATDLFVDNRNELRIQEFLQYKSISDVVNKAKNERDRIRIVLAAAQGMQRGMCPKTNCILQQIDFINGLVKEGSRKYTARFIEPTNANLWDEVCRRCTNTLTPVPKILRQGRAKYIEWLQMNYINAVHISSSDLNVMQKLLKEFTEEVESAKPVNDDSCQFENLRCIESYCDESNRSKFFTRQDSETKTELDSSKSDQQQSSFFEDVANLHNSDVVLKSDVFPEYEDFKAPIALHRIPKHDKTPEQMKEKLAKIRAKLALVISNWSSSGQGDGSTNDGGETITADSNRMAFITPLGGKKDLLYAWLRFEKLGMLESCIQSLNCGGATVNNVLETSSGRATVNNVLETSSGRATVNNVLETSSGRATVNNVLETSSGRATVNNVLETSSGGATVNNVLETSSGGATVNNVLETSSGGAIENNVLETSSGGAIENNVLETSSVKKTIPAKPDNSKKDDMLQEILTVMKGSKIKDVQNALNEKTAIVSQLSESVNNMYSTYASLVEKLPPTNPILKRALENVNKQEKRLRNAEDDLVDIGKELKKLKHSKDDVENQSDASSMEEVSKKKPINVLDDSSSGGSECGESKMKVQISFVF